MGEFWGNFGDIILAIVILVAGWVVASAASSFVKTMLAKFEMKLRTKVDFVEDTHEMSAFLGKLVKVIVFLLFLPAALDLLGVNSIGNTISSFVGSFLNYIPNLIVAIVVFVCGNMVAKLIGQILQVSLNKLKVDALLQTPLLQDTMNSVVKTFPSMAMFSISKFVGKLVQYIIMIVFAIQAFDALKLSVLDNIGHAVLAYLPSALSALIALIAGVLLAQWVKSLLKNISPFGAVAAQVVILVVTCFTALDQLNFAPAITTAAFIIVLAAIGLAFALAYGLGGRDFAKKTLDNIDTSKWGTKK